MLLLHLAYAGLCLASVFGAILFVGYTFHVKIRYPLIIVVIHLIVSAGSFVLFTVWTFHKLMQTAVSDTVFSNTFLIVAYVTFTVTLCSGLFFFLKYDARRKQMRIAMVGTHIVLACMTFIAVTSLLPLETPATVERGLHVTGRWALIHRNHEIRARFHRDNASYAVTHP